MMPIRLRALLVEDNPDDEFLIRYELEKNNFQIDRWMCITTTQEFEQAIQDDWDVILSDFSLPQFSTFAALDLLQHYHNDTPLIVVTGSVSEETAVECLRRGAMDYLLKDRLQRLSEAIKHALDKRQAQKALELSERKFHTIFNESLDAILVVHPDHDNILAANLTACRLFEYEPNILIGQPFETLLPSPEIMSEIVDDLEDRPAIYMVQRFATQTGKLIPMDLTATMIPWDDREAILVTLRDMTERLIAEQTRNETEKLVQQLRQATEMRELRSKFIAMISHDLGSPLSSIMLALDMLKNYWDRIDDYKRLQKIESLFKPLERMGTLLDEIVAMGEIEKDLDIYKPFLGDFESFCWETHAELTQQLPSTHTCILTTPGEPILMYFDPHLMHRIINNLHNNALKYSPEGGQVTWQIILENEFEVIFKISDQGIGIPLEEQSQLFEQFKRASNVGKIKGTGLGLAIVKQAVELHGGIIMVESVEGQGSTFILRFSRVRSSS